MQDSKARLTTKQQFDITVDLGELILHNGGELFRAQETMERVAAYFGLTDFSIYVLSDGIFASAALGTENYLAQIRAARLKDIELSRVEAANTLSREIIRGRYNHREIKAEIKRISQLRGTSDRQKIILSGVGSACFCYLFGGSPWDCAGAAIVGTLMYLIMLKVFVARKFPQMMVTIASALVAAGSCALLFLGGLGTDLDIMTIGSVFPLMPGVSFSNSIRNLLENDYLTGLSRLADAAITAVCISIGVGIVLALRQALGVL